MLRGKLHILPLITGKKDMPLRVGADLGPVQKHLGFPKWLYVYQNQPCGFLLGYGDLEIDILTRRNRARVNRISIKLWHMPDVAKSLPLKWSGNSQIDLDGFSPAMRLSSAKALLTDLGLHSEEYQVDSASETVRRLVLPHTELHFFRGPEEPILMEIHFLTSEEIRRTKGDWAF
ncbi:hypothetical protein EOA27_11925 [Mesorhizobium sp. M2A.F.Ca.ET.037.01.1.1]|uniref:hypothetical protein n=2 Tax=Mesorhizobium TaxID=68287 RepID=UPI000F75EDE0|nr:MULTISPECIES: hypothetical protein [unclassified Mesorhizobium]RUY10805.1 hypothetical protein EOA25_07665 [Mesorhizobium sp. M2A.F.Ca.ET.040.01.1.1]RVC67920.1 hypothetical protein EN759_13635 [Mesorhizobium sp. M00.F.Ca.ET.038.03.1.1]RVC74760.1 hypothetical protein EN766_17615 [Mesorhizobium sp. M2A.F.Ca.ET.046.02.1.1]AZO35523.1 hypothetical protein EJ072_14395 [Mesorhizobium sp. M2A.F.Ca.ET.046.03.2.1]RUX19237.1 hypothetical protein EOA27_11925 [Mesorhizobium sp. M2A.F.Ca.ET.037.01.1.1]